MKKILILLSVPLMHACALGALTESSFEVQPLGGGQQADIEPASVEPVSSVTEYSVDQVQEISDVDINENSDVIQIEVKPPVDIYNPKVLDAPLVEEILESPEEF